MKKLFLFAAMAIFAITANAQHEAGSFTITPKAGVNIASLTSSDDWDVRPGLAIGAEAEYFAKDYFSISAGVLYSQQGNKRKEDGVKYTTKFDYISIPILANTYVTRGLALKVGLQPSFKVNAKAKIKGGEDEAEGKIDDAKSFDLSIPVGLSYEFSKVPIVIDARYNFGLTHVIKDSHSKNSVAQITIGYKFSL